MPGLGSIKLKDLEFEASLSYKPQTRFLTDTRASKLDPSSTYLGQLHTSLVSPIDNHRLDPNHTSQHALPALQSNITGFAVARAAHWDL